MLDFETCQTNNITIEILNTYFHEISQKTLIPNVHYFLTNLNDETYFVVIYSSNQSHWVLIFCVEFWELYHLTRDLSQAEMKITVVTSQGHCKV